MLADVIGHELSHAADPRTEPDYRETFDECFDEEVVAYTFEHQYLRWVIGRFGELPGIDKMKTISKDDLVLYRNLSEISVTEDQLTLVRPMYQKQCTQVLSTDGASATGRRE